MIWICGIRDMTTNEVIRVIDMTMNEVIRGKAGVASVVDKKR